MVAEGQIDYTLLIITIQEPLKSVLFYNLV